MEEKPHPVVPGVTEGKRKVVFHRQREPEIRLDKRPITLRSGHGYEAYTFTTGGKTRSVVIVAIRGDELLLVKSYRASIGELIWELPRGFGEGDPSDDVQAARDGRRELREETGYEAELAEVIGEFVLDTTFYPSRVAVVRCTVTATAPSGQPDGEVEEHRWFPLRDMTAMVREATLRDGASLAALAIARV